MYFDHSETNKYRESTNRCASTPGIQFNTRFCKKCGLVKSITGGKTVRGSSRHNPGFFTCKDCNANS